MKLERDDIRWQAGVVDAEDRQRLLGQRGRVVWFTGLPASGKSTLAIELERTMAKEGRLVYRLDGDNLRHGLCSDLGFSAEDRRENIRRITEVAALFKDAGVVTLVSFISPERSMRDLARERIGEGYTEVWVKAALETCIRRDPKGLYKRALAGEIDDFTGISAPYEEPLQPELIIDTDRMSVAQAVERLKQALDTPL